MGKKPTRGQARLFSHPAIAEGRALLRAGAVRTVFNPVSDDTFATLKEALPGYKNAYAESALELLGIFEKLYEAHKQEDFTLAALDDTQLTQLEHHSILARSIVTNIERSGALVFDEAVKEAAEAVTRTSYGGGHVLTQAIRDERTAREQAKGEGQNR